MLVPVRCFNCNKVIGHLWQDYLDKIQEECNKEQLEKDSRYLVINENNPKTIENKVLDELGLTKICCRTTILSTIDLTESLTKTSYSAFNNF